MIRCLSDEMNSGTQNGMQFNTYELFILEFSIYDFQTAADHGTLKLQETKPR